LEGASALESVSSLACTGCDARYAVRGGIPVLLDEPTRREADAHAAKEDTVAYHAARHVAPANMEYYDYCCADLMARVPARKYTRVVELMCGGAELSRRATHLA